MKAMHSAAAEKTAVAVNSKHPVDEPASKTDRSKKVKTTQTGI